MFIKKNKYYTHVNFFLPFAYIMILGFFFTESTEQVCILTTIVQVSLYLKNGEHTLQKTIVNIYTDLAFEFESSEIRCWLKYDQQPSPPPSQKKQNNKKTCTHTNGKKILKDWLSGVILVPIKNSIWLPEQITHFNWLSLKALLFENYSVVWNLILCEWSWSGSLQSMWFFCRLKIQDGSHCRT